METNQAEFLLHQVFLPTLRNEHSITKGIIQAIPADKGDYRPDEVSKSASDLAWHIMASEIMFMKSVVAGEFSFGPPPSPADKLQWYAEAAEQSYEELSKMTGEQLAKVVDFRGMFQLPAVMYLNFLQNHSIHHRGQLAMYLRPMGAKVPAIYGESYDSSMARKLAQAQG